MTKRTTKSGKTHAMTAAELREIRLDLGFKPQHMRAVLGGLPRRTYQDYEAGKRRVPVETLRMARQVWQRNREFMATLPARLAALIERNHPTGIRSASEED